MKSRVANAVVEAVMLVASHTLAAKSFGAFWKRVAPKLQEGVSYIDRHEEEGYEADKTFLEVITFRDAEITRIVDSCLKDFMHSEVLLLIDHVQRIQDQINSRKEQINAWTLALISAPATSLMPLRVTRQTLQRRIKRERQSIDRDNERIQALKIQTLESLEASGIVMTMEQLDGLLFTAEGTQLAQVMAVAENIKLIQNELGQHLTGPETNSEQVKIYTGFLMMSYRVYVTAIERAIAIIRDKYLYKLSDIKNDANEQMWQADALSQRSEKTNDIARNNLELNAKTIELAQLYERHLLDRSQALERLLKEMKLNYELSVNTFRTIKVGGELIDVIKASEKDLQCIFEFDPPKLDAFYDKELRGEFDKKTQRLRGEA